MAPVPYNHPASADQQGQLSPINVWYNSALYNNTTIQVPLSLAGAASILDLHISSQLATCVSKLVAHISQLVAHGFFKLNVRWQQEDQLIGSSLEFVHGQVGTRDIEQLLQMTSQFFLNVHSSLNLFKQNILFISDTYNQLSLPVSLSVLS